MCIRDRTHSLQQPNQTAGVTGGMPQLIETVAKADIAVPGISFKYSRWLMRPCFAPVAQLPVLPACAQESPSIAVSHR